MIKDSGCHWVILGHSERRHVFGEPDAVRNDLGIPMLSWEFQYHSLSVIVYCVNTHAKTVVMYSVSANAVYCVTLRNTHK